MYKNGRIFLLKAEFYEIKSFSSVLCQFQFLKRCFSCNKLVFLFSSDTGACRMGW